MALTSIGCITPHVIGKMTAAADSLSFNIDGLKDDWLAFKPRVEDPKGDATGKIPGTDMKAVYAEFDDRFLYVMFEMWEKAASGNYIICIDIDNDLDYDYSFGFSKTDAWMYDLIGIPNYKWPESRLKYLASRDMPFAVREVAEAAIPLSLFESPEYVIIETWIYWWPKDITPDGAYLFDVDFKPKERDFAISDERPASYRIENVSQVWQEKMWCGPASLTIVMNYWGLDVKQKEIGEEVDPDHDGTWTSEMVDSARGHGFEAYLIYKYVERSHAFRTTAFDELKAWVSHDYPVIVLQYFGIEGKWKWEGHYRVITGYDDDKRLAHTVDPNEGELDFSYEDFEQYWTYLGYWGMVMISGTSTVDSDADGLDNIHEIKIHTDPFSSDSDGDGVSDKTEVDSGQNPLKKNPSYDVQVIVAGLPEETSTKMMIDGTRELEARSGERRLVTFAEGTSHEITVEAYIETDGLRYYCPRNTLSVNATANISFEYRKQYYLHVVNQRPDLSKVEGEGWYDENSMSTVRVYPSYASISFLVTAKFQGWTEDGRVVSKDPESTIRMDSAKTITATWKEETDYTTIILITVAIVAIVAVAVFAVFIVKRKKSRQPLPGMM
jgi:hypothetical protein